MDLLIYAMAYGVPILIVLGCALFIWLHIRESRTMERLHRERMQYLNEQQDRVRQQIEEILRRRSGS